MSSEITLAIDAMGGDDAPDMVIDGVAQARIRHPSVRFKLFGQEAVIAPLLARHSGLADHCEIVHAEDVVTMDAKPSQALRQGKNSSMWLSIQAVKQNDAHAIISAGNTGALMAMSKIALRMLPGIDRPAIGGFWPSRSGEVVMLDLGANAECSVQNLVEFAVMGVAFARCELGISRPRVGLLNIGSEEEKGTGLLKDARQILADSSLDMDFQGFVEGNDITSGTVDVIVTDGFTGNVALKTGEGVAKLFYGFMKEAVMSSFLAKVGYLLAQSALKKVVERTDPRRHNGAVFLGLNGTVVKSHGGTDALGFANAIEVAVDMVSRGVNEQIAESLGAIAIPETNQIDSEAIETVKAASTG